MKIKTASKYITCIHMYACSVASVQLCDPINCSPPGSSVHGILQARILEWVAMASSRGSSRPRDWTWVSCTGRWVLYPLSHLGNASICIVLIKDQSPVPSHPSRSYSICSRLCAQFCSVDTWSFPWYYQDCFLLITLRIRIILAIRGRTNREEENNSCDDRARTGRREKRRWLNRMNG